MRRFADRCRLSEARVASDLGRQFAKEAGDRGPDASVEVSVAEFRGVPEFGLGVVDVADDFVVFGMELNDDHKPDFPGTAPGEPEIATESSSPVKFKPEGVKPCSAARRRASSVQGSKR